MRITLVRHGETNANIQGIVQGKMDIELNETGINQAKKVGERLKNEKFDTIYASDLKRAAKTAEEIAKFHSNSINYDARLRERDFGDYESKKINDINWNYLKENLMNNRPPNGETLREHIERAQEFISSLSSKSNLVISHGGTIRILIHLLQNKKLEDFSLKVVPKNTSIYIFEKKGSKFEIVLENCIKHLS